MIGVAASQEHWAPLWLSLTVVLSPVLILIAILVLSLFWSFLKWWVPTVSRLLADEPRTSVSDEIYRHHMEAMDKGRYVQEATRRAMADMVREAERARNRY